MSSSKDFYFDLSARIAREVAEKKKGRRRRKKPTVVVLPPGIPSGSGLRGSQRAHVRRFLEGR